jgi:integron integrase
MSVPHPSPPATPVSPTGRPRLLDRVWEAIRIRHDRLRTEQADVDGSRRFILCHHQRHPLERGAAEINPFLTHLAVHGQVSASTQNQAFSALLFLYQAVREVDPGPIQGVVRAQRPRRLPVVLTRTEVQQVLAHLEATPHLVAVLLYGAGLRLLEALRLRVEDLEFTRGEIVVREGKGDKDWVTRLPAVARHPWRIHRERVRELPQRNWAEEFGRVDLPDALARKYPNADRDWGWPYVFPASARSGDPRSGVIRRHPLDESVIQRAVKEAVRRAGVNQPAAPPTFRQAFATHLLEDGDDIRTVPELLGHASVDTTMVDTPVRNRGGRAVRSPADRR